MEGDGLPAGWAIASLGAIAAHFESGKRPKGGVSKYTEGTISLGGEHLRSDGRVSLSNPKFVPDEFAATLDRVRVKADDILIVKDGATTGKTALATNEIASAVINEHLFQLRPEDGVNPRYLFHYLWSRSGNKEIMRDFRGSAQGGITKGVLDVCEVRIAPSPEQQCIVETIETLFVELDKGEEALREVRKLLARYRQSVLKAAVTGTLTADWRAANGPPEENAQDLLARILKTRRETWQGRGKYKEPVEPYESDLPELPQGWEWVSIDAIGSVTKLAGFEYSKYVKYDAQGDWPVIKAENVAAKRYHTDRMSRVKSETVSHLTRSELHGGEVLMVFVGANLGRASIVPGDQKYFLGPNVAVIRVNPEHCNPAYLEKFLDSDFGFSLAVGIAVGAAQGSISMGRIRQIPVALPPIEEQNEILEKLAEHEAQMSPAARACDAELQRSAALRQSILKDAFSGKLVPQDPADEPADKLLARIRAEREAAPKAKRKKATA